MAEETPRQRAIQLFQRAYEHQMNGELDQALELYTQSIDLFPTAEAYTFRGWTYSFMGDFDRAIEECLRAIEVDPDYGNPYNDIGAYLIEEGRLDEAIFWLEKATLARRYESYCFPHFNLGRVYERKRDYVRATQCYKRALEINANYKIARERLKHLTAQWN